ncbi:MAG: hypothetical protein K1Y36_23640 [Blastocatellia bacterium]|nr:hypothetical protein [Blastocatellia bacterium]
MSPYSQKFISKLFGVMTLLVVTGLAFQSMAQSSGPNIGSVTIARNGSGKVQATVTGTGFVNNGSVVEINGIAAKKTKSIKGGALPDGSPTRLRPVDDRIEAINTSGDQAVFQVLNTSSQARSNTFIANPNAKPSLSAMSVAAGKAGTTVATVLEGKNLVGATVAFSGNGITATVGTTNNPTRLPVTLILAGDAQPGSRTITITTPGGTVQNDSLRFVITAPDETKPVVSGISPSNGKQGTNLEVVISGFRLNGPTKISIGGGITVVVRTAASNDTQISALLMIAADAAPGTRTVSVTTANGISAENVNFTVEAGTPAPTVTLTKFIESPDKTPDLYHMTEVPDGSYAVTQYSTRSLVLANSAGTVTQVQRSSFLLVSSIAFYSRDVAYTTCVPTILASRSFRPQDFGFEGLPPGNLGGVSNPRYMMGVDGLISRTFFLSNGGTGEIRLIDPDTRSTSKVIANGFTLSSTDANTRGLEQLAYDKKTRTIFALDSGKGTLVAVDEVAGSQKVLRSGFKYPFGLALMPNGNLLVSDRGDGSLTEVTTAGQLVNTYDTKQGADALRGLFVNSKGEIFLIVDKVQTVFRVTFN